MIAEQFQRLPVALIGHRHDDQVGLAGSLRVLGATDIGLGQACLDLVSRRPAAGLAAGADDYPLARLSQPQRQAYAFRTRPADDTDHLSLRCRRKDCQPGCRIIE